MNKNKNKKDREKLKYKIEKSISDSQNESSENSEDKDFIIEDDVEKVLNKKFNFVGDSNQPYNKSKNTIQKPIATLDKTTQENNNRKNLNFDYNELLSMINQLSDTYDETINLPSHANISDFQQNHWNNTTNTQNSKVRNNLRHFDESQINEQSFIDDDFIKNINKKVKKNIIDNSHTTIKNQTVKPINIFGNVTYANNQLNQVKNQQNNKLYFNKMAEIMKNKENKSSNKTKNNNDQLNNMINDIGSKEQINVVEEYKIIKEEKLKIKNDYLDLKQQNLMRDLFLKNLVDSENVDLDKSNFDANNELNIENIESNDNKSKLNICMYQFESIENICKYQGKSLVNSISGIALIGKTAFGNKTETCIVVVPEVNQSCQILPSNFITKDLKELNSNQLLNPEGFNNQKNQLINKVKDLMDKLKIQNYSTQFEFKTYVFDDTHAPREKIMYIQISQIYNNKKIQPSSIHGYDCFKTVQEFDRSKVELFTSFNQLRTCKWFNFINLQKSDIKVTNCKFEYIQYANESSISENTDERVKNKIPNFNILSIYPQITESNQLKKISMIQIDNQYGGKPQSKEQLITKKKIVEICLIKGKEPEFQQFSKMNNAFELNQIKVNPLIFDTEVEFLKYFLVKIKDQDPDLIIGHRISFEFMEKIQSLMRVGKSLTPNFHFLSRLLKTNINQQDSRKFSIDTVSKFSNDIVAGRTLLDTYVTAHEHLGSLENYDLDFILNHTEHTDEWTKFDDNHLQFCTEVFSRLVGFVNSLVELNFKQIELSNTISVLPLSIQICQISGVPLSIAMANKRAERIETMLVQWFQTNDQILPEKTANKKHQQLHQSLDQNTSQEGGLVLDPKSGQQDSYILLLDFNSLQPSLIREYNFCFTTTTFNFKDTEESLRILQSKPMGVLPQVVAQLIEERKKLKNLIKLEANKADSVVLDIKQKAFKITANSLYGCLGQNKSRFYAVHIAGLITKLGRQNLLRAKSIAEEKMFLNVIQGDTDSIMINSQLTKKSEALIIANNLKQEINNNLKQLEIDIDGLFRKLLLQKKKKYAALKENINNEVLSEEVKGLDIVRRDWSAVAKKVGRIILNIILKGDSADQIVEMLDKYLRQVKESLSNINSLILKDFIITEKINKDIEAYDAHLNSPHLIVARELKRLGKLNSNQIEYVICQHKDQPNSDNIALKSHSYNIILPKKDQQIIDTNYQIESQIYPVASRLLSIIDFIDQDYQFRDVLGVKKYKSVNENKVQTQINPNINQVNQNRDKNMENNIQNNSGLTIKLQCEHCNIYYLVYSVIVVRRGKCNLCNICPTCERKNDISCINNSIQEYLRGLKIEMTKNEEECSECKNPFSKILLPSKFLNQCQCNKRSEQGLTPMAYFEELNKIIDFLSQEKLSNKEISSIDAKELDEVREIKDSLNKMKEGISNNVISVNLFKDMRKDQMLFMNIQDDMQDHENL